MFKSCITKYHLPRFRKLNLILYYFERNKKCTLWLKNSSTLKINFSKKREKNDQTVLIFLLRLFAKSFKIDFASILFVLIKKHVSLFCILVLIIRTWEVEISLYNLCLWMCLKIFQQEVICFSTMGVVCTKSSMHQHRDEWGHACYRLLVRLSPARI